jgi:hypothetical protein
LPSGNFDVSVNSRAGASVIFALKANRGSGYSHLNLHAREEVPAVEIPSTGQLG